MTVSQAIPVNNYVGNGVNKIFDFDFPIENKSELTVTHISKEGIRKELVLGLDYVINEQENNNDGFKSYGQNITFPLSSSSYDVLKEGEQISLALNLPIEQQKELKNSSKLNLSTFEWCLDYLTRLIQILNRKMERTVKVQEGTVIDVDKLVKNIEDIAINQEEIFKLSSHVEEIYILAEALKGENSIKNLVENIAYIQKCSNNIDVIKNTSDILNIIQQGITEYNTETKYNLGSVVREKNTFKIYGSIKNENKNNPLADSESWMFLADLSLLIRVKTAFSINSCNTSEGKADIIKAEGKILSFNVGDEYESLIATSASGEAFILNSIPNVDLSECEDGVYNGFVSKNNIEFLKNNLYYSPNSPAEPKENDVWLNTLKEPLAAYKYVESSWIKYEGVPIGSVTISEENIQEVVQPDLNTNFYNLNGSLANKHMIVSWNAPDYTKEIPLIPTATVYQAPFNGYVVGSINCSLYESSVVTIYNAEDEVIQKLYYGYSTRDVNQYNLFFPLSKGEKIKFEPTGAINYYDKQNNTLVNDYVQFIPMKGE